MFFWFWFRFRPKVKNILSVILEMSAFISLPLKEAGRGGAKSARWPGDCLPFLTGSYCGHKNSWLYPLTSKLQGTKVIFWLSWQVFQKFSQNRWKITKQKSLILFQIWMTIFMRLLLRYIVTRSLPKTIPWTWSGTLVPEIVNRLWWFMHEGWEIFKGDFSERNWHYTSTLINSSPALNTSLAPARLYIYMICLRKLFQ